MAATDRVIILGGGPAGLAAAFRLMQRRLAPVTLIEPCEEVGGTAGSFLLDGLPVDYGSHRLHPACDPEILRDLHALLGVDLLYRPRHGRIRFRGRWLDFPLRPGDLLRRLPLGFSSRVCWETLSRPFRQRTPAGEETFAAVLEAGLGATMCREFYFPYARKLWGLPPEALSAMQARRRVSAASPLKMLRKILAAVPGLKPPGAGHFYYPRGGFGRICECLYEAARSAGAEFLLGCRARAVHLEAGRVRGVTFERGKEVSSVEGCRVWSTAPINFLVRSLDPPPPAEVLRAAEQLTFRGMILVYLVLETPCFSEYDAHYFPDEAIPVSRLSEPRHYSLADAPEGRTVVCAELPCQVGDAHWKLTDQALGELVCQALAQAGLPVNVAVRQVVTRRLDHAYPVAARGFEQHFEHLDAWTASFGGLLSFGRQGLFVHDNTHHALAMGYAAADCLRSDGQFDAVRWAACRRKFATHVVED